MKKNNIIEFIKEYWILLGVIVWPLLIFIALFFVNPKISSDLKLVHWHMPLSYDLCWDTTQLKDWPEHWPLHWHDDGKIHMEWYVNPKKRTETLWKFFDADGIVFSKTQIQNYKNWDKCPWSNTPWKVSVIINWKPNFDFRDYILNDDDNIKIIFK